MFTANVLWRKSRMTNLEMILASMKLENLVNEGIKYGKKKRPWSDAFIKYAYAITAHPHYKDMPAAQGSKGQILWNAPSYRPKGEHQFLRDERLVWWKQKADQLGVERTGDWISRVAKAIHPFGEKPCQICGRLMSLDYIYATQSTINRFNKVLPAEKQLKYTDFYTIYQIIEHLVVNAGDSGYDVIERVFHNIKGTNRNINSFQNAIAKRVVPFEPKSILSPGSMSNAPDKLCGFHPYNLCCRNKADTGRTSDNLRSYGVDRRVFEQWVEGDWAAADALMNCTSEGFCTRPQCPHRGERLM